MLEIEGPKQKSQSPILQLLEKAKNSGKTNPVVTITTDEQPTEQETVQPNPLIAEVTETENEVKNQPISDEKPVTATNATVNVTITTDEQPTAQENENPNSLIAEVTETEKEKQKVITILRAFFQEQNKNTATHTQMAKNIETMRKICESSLVYYSVANPKCSDFTVVEDWTFQGRDYHEIVVRFLNQEGEKRAFLNQATPLIKLTKEKKYQNDSVLKELHVNYDRVSKELLSLKDALWKEKETIAQELLNIGFEKWKGKGLKREHKGLYDVDGKIISDGNYLKFSLNHSDMIEEIKRLKIHFNISDEELADIQEIDWSNEDKIALTQLKEVAKDFSADQTEAIKSDLVASFPDFKFSPSNLAQLARIYREGAIRSIYSRLALPPQFEGIVVEKIMLDQIDF